MAHLVLLLLLLGAGMAAVAGGAGALAYRRRRDDPGAEGPESRTLVRVLRSDEELREAVDKAVRFEQIVADSLQTRTRRYEAMVRPAAVTQIGVGGTRTEIPDDPAPRSA